MTHSLIANNLFSNCIGLQRDSNAAASLASILESGIGSDVTIKGRALHRTVLQVSSYFKSNNI